MHVAVRIATLVAVIVAVAVTGGDLAAALGKSDGVWYLGIARHGYGTPPPIGPDGSYTQLTPLAFFPLYPATVRAVHLVGVPYLPAALVVTFLAGAAAAALLALWARPLLGDRGAVVLVTVWELLPSSVVLSLAYSEALFTAAAAGCLLAVQRQRWLLAGVAATVAGLTRPTGGALVLAVWVAAGFAVRRGAAPQRPLLGAALAPLGLVAALAHVAIATGRWDGWLWVERTVWRSGFDGGWTVVDHVGQLVSGGRAAHRLPEVVAAAVIAAALAALVVWLRRPQLRRAPDVAYTVPALVLAVGERSYFYVKPRLLLVCLPLLLPVARRLASWPRGRLLTGAAIIGIGSLAYNAYLVAGWPKAL